MRNAGVAVLWSCAVLAGCSSSSKTHGVGAEDQAATVLAASGAVSFERAGTSKPLAVGDALRRGDIIVTGVDGTATVRLLHNNARWTLSAGKRKQIDQSVAWRAPASSSGSALAAGGSEVTAAAGRHAEKQAADTRATASLVTESALDKAAPGDGASTPAKALRAARAEAKQDLAPPPPAAPAEKSPPAPRSMTRKSISRSRRDAPGRTGVLRSRGGASDGLLGDGAPGRGAIAGRPGRTSPVVRIRTSKPQVTGNLSMEIIRRVLRSHLPALRACYARAAAKDGGARDMVKTIPEFTIASSGKVSQVKIGGDPYPLLDACLKSRLERIRFPAPKSGTVTVRYPMVFTRSATQVK